MGDDFGDLRGEAAFVPLVSQRELEAEANAAAKGSLACVAVRKILAVLFGRG